MLSCECAPATSSQPPALGSQRHTPYVQSCPSRRSLLQTSLQLAAALISGNAWTACHAPRAEARVLKVQKGGAGERDVIVLSSGGNPVPACTWCIAEERIWTPGIAPATSKRRAAVQCPGVMVADVREGHGSSIRTGDLIVAHIVGSLEDGTVFVNTRAGDEQALTFELGIQNDVITDGLEAAIANMRFGGQRLAVVPPELGYGPRGQKLPLASVPRNATLYYEIELLRCEELDSAVTICCDEAHFPCTAPDADDDEGELASPPMTA